MFSKSLGQHMAFRFDTLKIRLRNPRWVRYILTGLLGILGSFNISSFANAGSICDLVPAPSVASTATGIDALACGTNNTASSQQAVALGYNNTVTGAGGVAVGSYNEVRAGSDGGIAVGYESIAANIFAVAFGYESRAYGSYSSAIGSRAETNAHNATAVGRMTFANHENSTAIGYNATTTSANQMMFGSSSAIYAMPGLTSNASKAAQNGATQFITTDANGNLAASGYGAQDIAGLQTNVSGLQTNVAALQNGQAILGQTIYNQGNRINANQAEARQGIAMAAAMGQAPMPSAPGKTSWKFNNAIYKNAAATSLSIAHRLPTRVPIAVTAGVAIGLRNSALITGGMQGEF